MKGVISINKNLLIIPGYIIGIICLFLISYRTLIAFISEGKAVIIYINKYGEQYLDLVSLIIIWIISLLGLYFLCKTLSYDKVVTVNNDNFVQKKQSKNVSLSDLNTNPNYNKDKNILFSKSSDDVNNNFNEE